ncbi:zinc finger CCCH domain-containing protein 4-like [Mercenaria mercenaria]|uniref:zinc finger CCCH domain-containing protein 4-like n=1 Tax=Mercenaria mercenaria TaxID=6596 RepID=UPI00234E5527|nr:zinc finger CCCH domain-containing protein 4-like [Mercenaria mercenaria]XP_053384198.1 zinc finger CCCH domain-containing protein 4-like [Mercenaria mercenaria]XP_053384199.1 zinc finger CCCH domain-containing protein 4-like [Mercenaria mercenaria]XP_053384200.1 zinc finger CCCH domain-containing protein 4-like [Mercenaria mercenaria]
MIMETENQSIEQAQELAGNNSDENMAPQDNEGIVSDSDMGHIEQKENKDPLQMNSKLEGSDAGTGTIEKKVEQMSADEGTADDAEDGEILEDGEIASDQDGEINEEEEEEGEDKSNSNKSSPTKQRSGGHREDHKRRGHDKRDRHSKRRRTSKEEHKDKQKKKRHKDYDYDKSGEDYDSSWSDTRREKNDRKHDSPAHDSHSEDKYSGKHDKDGDKRRRGSGENRHHSGRDRERGKDRDKSSVDKDKTRDRSRDRHDRDRGDKSNKKDRSGRDRDRGKGRSYGDGYDSPPGLYDSPSDDEYDASRYADKKLEFGMEGEYMEMDMEQPMPKGKRKQQQQQQQQQQKKFDRRRQRNDRGEDFEEDAPAKKKPLLQTPMEERPVCRFFKEGKCQKGPDCPFNHDYQPQKRLELCKYHLQSYCRKEGCVFMHEDFPCKYFHTGSTCYQGDNCKFSHQPLTEETDMALQNLLKEREDWEEDFGERKHKKKGLLGDQPHMSEQEIQKKLEDMKSIPSIFDIETHKPGESPNKPPPKMGQSPNIRLQGGFPDQGMHQQMGPGGPNMRFNGPPNQGGPPRPPFMGPPGPGMDGPPMNMQGPPPMVSGANMGNGPGLMGPGPAPMMSGPGMSGPGMQGPPLGPPMSQAAALVGAILRAAPMLQQYRGPGQQGPKSMQGDPRFMGPNVMGQGPNMMGPPPNMSGSIMSPGQDGMMGDNQQGMMGMGQGQQVMMNQGQGSMMQDEDMNQQQTNQNMNSQMNMAGGSNIRDPRKLGAQNDPRLKREDQEITDVDMRPVKSGESSNLGDQDFRQDVDMRQEDSGSNQGDHTPQQNWDEDNSEANNEDDMEIPSHLPPKQREMFMRIRQHQLKMQQQKTAENNQQLEKQQNTASSMKMDDDKWYSSDEDEDVKPPNISNILTSLSQPKASESIPANTASSSINVMQMINAIKSSNTASSAAPSRPNDPRTQAAQSKAFQREPAIINSRDGDCPWRLLRVMYVKQRIPDNINMNDSKYKLDPRVQKMLKLQELESGKVIDHSKTVVPVKSELHKSSSEHKLPNLLDPRVFKEKQTGPTRPELTPFIDPRSGMKQESDQTFKPELPVQRPLDPRLKPGLEPPAKPLDPRVQRMTSNPGMPARAMDPRLARQDSNSPSAINPASRPFDPRLARQNSHDSQPGSRGSTPPIDPRMFNRQPSSEPKITKLENLPSLPLDLGLGVSPTSDPRLGKVTEADSVSSVHRQISQPGTSAEKEAARDLPKPKLDYRNDPRFKRKRISDASLSPDITGKRFSGQRKSSTEYSSPLGGDTSQQSEESGYNSYNRPRPVQPQPVQSRPQTTNSSTSSETVPSASSDVSAHDILDSLQIMPPPGLDETQGSDKNLKDIFKTIDPTASPFC